MKFPTPMTLNRIKTKLQMFNKQLKGQSLVDRAIGIMIAAIVIGAVAIPVTGEVVAEANVSGMAGTVLEYVDLGLALSLFIASISIIRR